jgi:thiol-disulfide isomerase/thioredoxin
LVLNFWATWCGPCLTEVPHLVGYEDRYGHRGLQIVGIGIDEPRKIANVARTLGINYPVLLAQARHASRLLGAWGNPEQGLPYTVVIGKDGTIRFRYRGILDEETFNSNILPLLGTPAGSNTTQP